MTVLYIVIAMKPVEGNYAENAISFGVAGLNIDASRVETFPELTEGKVKVVCDKLGIECIEL